MASSRRDVLKATAALAAPQFIIHGARAAEVFDPAEPVAYFEAQGYVLLDPHPLIADYGFNGGVRFDEAPAPQGDGKTIRLQPCARIEDLARRGEPGVLPYFHILAYRNPAPAYPGEMTAQVLDFLVNGSGLDPHRMVVVSTELVDPLRPVFMDYGIGPSQIVQRAREAAEEEGDGSGYFSPPGHPHAPEMATASIHYPHGEPPPQPPTTYPVEGYIELAEVSLPGTKDDPVEEGGLGIERVAMAGDGVIDTYEEALVYLVAALEDEAEARDVPLPEGYHTFKTL